MNSINDNQETSRPFGFWLKAVDRLMAAEFAAAFESFGVTRREWRLLNRIDGAVPSERGPVPAHKLSRLIELGWVEDADGTWALTDEGRDAKQRLRVIVDSIRTKVTDAVPAEDLATTLTTLEQLARAFGWDESTPLPRGGGHGRGRRGFGSGGFDRRRGHGFGAHRHSSFGHEGHGAPESDGHEHCRHGEHSFAFGAEHGHRGGPHPHEDHGHHGRARFARFARGAYERGFDAGFTRGRDDH